MGGLRGGLMEMGRGVKALPQSERPREKLLARGAGALDDSELIAVILGTGGAGRGVLEVADRLRTALGPNLAGLDQTATLAAVQGVGPARAARMAAAFELARRALEGGHRPSVESAEEAFAVVRDLVRRRTEHLVALLLNGNRELLARETVAVGAANRVYVQPRDVFSPALQAGAAEVVLAHNHPSGRLAPSADDLHLTRRLSEAGRLVGVPIRDHLIVAGQTYLSFREEGLL